MRVFTALGILLLIAVSEGRRSDHEQYCCNHKKHISDIQEKGECVTFSKLVEQHERNRYTESKDQRREEFNETPLEKIKAKVQAFSDASLECVVNNRVFRNVHSVMDDLHAALENYPGPANALKQISQAMDYMEEHFDDVHAAKHAGGPSLSEPMLDRIEHFVIANAAKAVGVFEKNNLAARVALEVFNNIPIAPLVGRLVEKVEHSLGFKMPSFGGLFSSRQGVRATAKEISHKVAEIQHEGKRHSPPAQHSIDQMLLHFDADMKQLKSEMEAEQLERKHKGH